MRSRPLLVALLLLSGCTKETTRPSSFTFVGTWTLISINGSPVPYSFSLSGYPAKVASASLVVSQDSTASFTIRPSRGAARLLGPRLTDDEARLGGWQADLKL